MSEIVLLQEEKEVVDVALISCLLAKPNSDEPDESDETEMELKLHLREAWAEFLKENPETQKAFWTDMKSLLERLADSQIEDANAAIAARQAVAEPSIIIARH